MIAVIRSVAPDTGHKHAASESVAADQFFRAYDVHKLGMIK